VPKKLEILIKIVIPIYNHK